jgi:hypothetical protein
MMFKMSDASRAVLALANPEYIEPYYLGELKRWEPLDNRGVRIHCCSRYYDFSKDELEYIAQEGDL